MASHSAVLGLLLCIGLVVAGGAVGWGFKEGRERDRFVAVKGLSELAVKADQGTWNVSFQTVEPSLETAVAENLKDTSLVIDFLKSKGFADSEIRKTPPRVHSHRDEGQQIFTVSASLRVVSDKVDALRDAAAASSELLANGVALSGWENPHFYYSRLSDIKPQMIEEATKDARKAAEQFARDSGSLVGSIKQASQGYFSFKGESEGVNETEQINKIARVVVTIDYLIQ